MIATDSGTLPFEIECHDEHFDVHLSAENLFWAVVVLSRPIVFFCIIHSDSWFERNNSSGIIR